MSVIKTIQEKWQINEMDSRLTPAALVLVREVYFFSPFLGDWF